MTMQRRHYELIAETIAELPNRADSDFTLGQARQMRRDVAQHFARALRSTNPNFNEARFLRACGVE